MAATDCKRRFVTTPVAPAPKRDFALFLDIDGTLLDIAPTPDAVQVPNDLARDLARAAAVLGGALAVVSGRDLADIDALLAPLHLPLGSEHGAVIRLPNRFFDEVPTSVPEEWKLALRNLAEACPGVLAEAKHHNVVAHYRNAPRYAEAVRDMVRALVAEDPANFELLEAKMAFEIRPRHVSKARAVYELMNVAPFSGRVPVFVGDDLTDQDGFAAAVERGGLALDVAEAFAGRPAEVRLWLKRFADL